MPDEMKRLSDFKPLRRVTLPGLGDLECSGLIVVVGHVVMLLRRVLTTEAQWDRRWILVVLAAVIVAAVAGIVVGSLLNPN